MHPWAPMLFSVVLLLVLFFGDSSASTSSTLLRHGRGRIGQLTRSVSGRARQSVLQRKEVLQEKVASLQAFAPPPISTGSIGNSASVSSGFRQFSKRAEQIQRRVNKPFSFRAIFGDVLTNNSDQESALEHMIPGAKRPRPLAALTSIAGTAANEALAGFVGGYVLGAATQSTRRLYGGLRRSTIARPPKIMAITLLPYPYITQLSLQSLRFHAHNMAWAGEWAKISAVFGACRMLVKTARQDSGEEEGWNSVAGSVIAGAILAAPKQMMAPVAKTRGALLYGGSMFLLHPYLWKDAMEAMWLTPPACSSPNEPWYNGLDLFLQ